MKLSPKPHNLDDSFREGLKDFEAQPSELAWFGIEAHLPVKNVLSNPFRIGAGIAASAVVLSFAAYLALTGQQRLTAISAIHFTPNDLDLVMPALAEQDEVMSLQPAKESVSEVIRPLPIAGPIAASPASGYEFEKPMELKSLKLSGIRSLPLTMSAGADARVLDEGVARGVHVGAIVGINNTWLFAGTDGGRGRFSSDYKPTVGPAYGFAIGLDFSTRGGIEVDVMASSAEGQTYEIMTEDGPVRSAVSLNYMRIPVMYKHRFIRMSGLLNTPVTFNYMAGLQYGRLNWVNADPLVRFISRNEYNVQELGIIVGAEYGVYFSDNYLLSIGARASVNNTISAFPFFMSDEYAETANFAVGVSLKLSYLFD